MSVILPRDMKPPRLSRADLRILRVLFDDAHRRGRLTGAQHDRTVSVLTAAAQRQAERPGPRQFDGRVMAR